ncbi:VWA domain-containing protein [Flammeovirga agarivorans]|uniref:VWA domain-containing protein n=1 Tax=Flammeovirga agarivorans TaxID=2726742 RepID=A0A7X8SMJ8_9BACT|nr:VWA domain-containing protein [Flammeovirga agarivorans]NLR92994.1 VWA domain-containing protein [Flammeovirga agarivorans]
MNNFPFTAIIGQESFKLALILNIIDPTLGGVLAVGDKGTGKTTLIRSLSDLMQKPFVNLPIGASEDRVLGHINLEKLINDKKEEVQSGLLSQAHQGFLYIDEINLLNDYLMDVLLDASATGCYHLEREGVSRKLDSRFCLIGSMNPEEGDLRPQLKDRFGLSVEVKTPTSLEERVQIVQNRLAFDDNPRTFSEGFDKKQKQLFAQILTAQEKLSGIELESDVMEYCSQLSLEHAVEGVRADILLIKTARAYVAFQKREKVTKDDVKAIQEFVLLHRKNQNPPNQEPPQTPPSPEEQKKEQQETLKEETPPAQFESVIPDESLTLNQSFKESSKQVIHQNGMKSSIDTRKTVGQYLATDNLEVIKKSKVEPTKKQVIFILDSSGSMIKGHVITYAKGAVQKMIEKYKSSDVQFSLISLYQNEAEILVQETSNVAFTIEKINHLKTGGKTNILAALKKTKRMLVGFDISETELVIISDGHFCAETALEDIISSYQFHCRKVDHLTLVDAESGVVRLGIMKELSNRLRGNYQKLSI